MRYYVISQAGLTNLLRANASQLAKLVISLARAAKLISVDFIVESL